MLITLNDLHHQRSFALDRPAFDAIFHGHVHTGPYVNYDLCRFLVGHYSPMRHHRLHRDTLQPEAPAWFRKWAIASRV